MADKVVDMPKAIRRSKACLVSINTAKTFGHKIIYNVQH